MNGADRRPVSSEPATRRRLLAVLGAGGLAAAASMLPRSLRAGHGDPGAIDAEALHLGHENSSDASTSVSVASIATLDNPDPLGLTVHIPQGRAISGHSSIGVGLWGHSNDFSDDNPGVGVEGTAHHDGTGVRGQSKAADGEGPGSGAGVVGESGSGPGVEGTSSEGPGVRGSSQSGPGLEAFSQSGSGAFVGSDTGAGIDATSGTGPGVLGWSPEGAGVVGIGSIVRGLGEVPEAAPGVLGIGPGAAAAVRCVSGRLDGSDSPFPVPVADGGLALDVVGKARFSTAGAGVVPPDADTAFVAATSVTAISHISVTLAGNPGKRTLGWVERDPGNGFRVYLSDKKGPATPFTYLIVEPES